MSGIVWDEFDIQLCGFIRAEHSMNGLDSGVAPEHVTLPFVFAWRFCDVLDARAACASRHCSPLGRARGAAARRAGHGSAGRGGPQRVVQATARQAGAAGLGRMRVARLPRAHALRRHCT